MDNMTKVCEECGKVIYITDGDGWVYKRSIREGGHNKRKYYCSWKCFRQDEIRKGIDRNGKKTSNEK